MTDEAALLSALRADPLNDLPRLVYADWLDDRGDPARAEYLRASAEIDRLRARLAELAAVVPADWRRSVGRCLLLTGYPLTHKISVIRVVRMHTGAGLAEAKAMVEALPLALPFPPGSALGEQVRRDLEASGGQTAYGLPSG